MKNLILFIYLTLLPVSLFAQSAIDYSNKSSIKFDEPKLAYVNITGVDSLPATKTDDMHAWIEYSDENGVYFKKKVILNAQGNSSLAYPKKNLSVDFCEDDWIGDDTPDIQIGNWVKQDGFHFKANWIDSFRGGLAVATAYKFYDDIASGDTPLYKRAGLTDYNKNALYHPDGFPCVISLNGEFQGVYAWQLKKHRKNMNLEKDNPKHVWFQIDDYKSSLDSARVIWEGLDIKNPKVLTAESKMYMENLFRYKTELDTLETFCSADIMREEISKRFDVTSVIDFIIHGLIVSNIDGFGKNVNFFTFDGIKWFVMPYDLDETFGNSWIASFQFLPQWSFCFQNYEMQNSLSYFPFRWIMKYYRNDLEKQYAILRESSVISVETIMSHLNDWNDRVGTGNYQKEYAKWNTCLSNRQTVIDDNWEWKQDYGAQYYNTPDYEDTLIFQKGDACCFDYRFFEARNKVVGRKPVIEYGYTDTKDRVREWLEQRIELEDSYLGYNSSAVNLVERDKDSCIVRKVIRNGRPCILIRNDIYTLDGVRFR